MCSASSSGVRSLGSTSYTEGFGEGFVGRFGGSSGGGRERRRSSTSLRFCRRIWSIALSSSVTLCVLHVRGLVREEVLIRAFREVSLAVHLFDDGENFLHLLLYVPVLSCGQG